MSKFHVGTMGWSYDFWKGGFYPENLSSDQLLTYYSKQFSTVEVDNTFYRIPREKTVTEWKDQTPRGFVFSLKFPQVITHVKMLKDCQQETQIFLERIQLFEEKLGVLLLQFPPMFQSEHLALLEEYLRTLPKAFRFAVEVRNKKLLNEELYSMLKANHVALVWVEAGSQPPVSEVTADFLYVRWEGDRKKVNGKLGKVEVSRAADLKSWAVKLRPLSEKMEVFGYFSKYYSGFPPSDVSEFLKATEQTS
jgi:uncharacterized protein YecE (DUF72 family)